MKAETFKGKRGVLKFCPEQYNNNISVSVHMCMGERWRGTKNGACVFM
jgi:hypothetical protein